MTASRHRPPERPPSAAASPSVRVGLLATLLGSVALVAVGPAPAEASQAPDAPLRSVARVEQAGPVDAVARCAGRWAPIQAKVSGFVVGNCRGGAVVRVTAVDICAPGCIRGGRAEGRAWAATSPPVGGRYRSCGWVNVRNRLGPAHPADASPRSRCGHRDGPDLPWPQAFVKRDTGRSVGGAPPPSTATYRGLYLWAGRFTSGANRGREGGAIPYRPRLGRGRACVAYANVDPTRPGQRVSLAERMWTVHDGSRHLQIRYIARFRARDEQGRPRWWVNAHSTAREDRDRPWGFVAAECLFAGEGPQATRPRPRPAQPLLARVVREPWPVDRVRCDFTPVGFHRVVGRHGLSCADARKAIRRLKGEHALAPMACGRPRRVQGWRLTNRVRDPSLGVTRFTRGRTWFEFARHQFPGSIWCPTPR